jgi:acyl-ACP thioesterase
MDMGLPIARMYADNRVARIYAGTNEIMKIVIARGLFKDIKKNERYFKTVPCYFDFEVQWGEMDALQHVNNVVYVRWGETARIDYFRADSFHRKMIK